jgi:hypothetical protein
MADPLQIGLDAAQRLAFPDGARGNRPRASVARSAVAAVCVVIGLTYLPLALLGFFPPFDSFAEVIPRNVAWIEAAVGVCWIGLGAGVWRDAPQSIRRRLALILIGGGLVRCVWALTPVHHAELANYRASAAELWFLCTLHVGIGFGVWRAQEWGRRGLFVLGVALAAWQVLSGLAMLLFELDGLPRVPIGLLVLSSSSALVFPIGIAIYASRPSTRGQFVEARAARSRAADKKSRPTS